MKKDLRFCLIIDDFLFLGWVGCFWVLYMGFLVSFLKSEWFLGVDVDI